MSGRAATCMALYQLQQKCLSKETAALQSFWANIFTNKKNTLMTKLYYIKKGDVSTKDIRVMTIWYQSQ